jgi:hypothetical protein
MPTLFISAGEASGEHYGALLIEALKRQLASTGQTATFFGMGGDRMVAAGLDRVVRSEDMAVMGITEVIRHLPRIYARVLETPPVHPRPQARRRRAHRFPRHPLQTGRRTPPPPHPRNLLRQPPAMGLEETPHQTRPEVRHQNARHLPLRRIFLSRARHPSRVRRPPPRRATPAHDHPRTVRSPKTASIPPKHGSACSPAAAPKRFATISPKY